MLTYGRKPLLARPAGKGLEKAAGSLAFGGTTSGKNVPLSPTGHPQGDNIVIATDVETPFQQNYGPLKVRFEGLESFVSRLTEHSRPESPSNE